MKGYGTEFECDSDDYEDLKNAIEREGLTFPSLDDATEAVLGDGLPPAANIHNPIDVLGDALADRYEFAVETVLEDPNVDTVLVLLTPQAMTECEATAAGIASSRKSWPGYSISCSGPGRFRPSS